VSDDAGKQAEPRCQILQHAMTLFAHYGYAKTNIGDIAKECCMSPGNLYRHFRNKQAIGEEVVREYMASEQADLELIADKPGIDCETRLHQFFQSNVGRLMEELRTNPKLIELAQMIMDGDSGILAHHIEWKRDRIIAMLHEGIEAGRLQGDPAAMSCVLLDMTRGFLMPQALAQMDFDKVPARLDALLNLALAGMRTTTDGP